MTFIAFLKYLSHSQTYIILYDSVFVLDVTQIWHVLTCSYSDQVLDRSYFITNLFSDSFVWQSETLNLPVLQG